MYAALVPQGNGGALYLTGSNIAIYSDTTFGGADTSKGNKANQVGR